MNLNRCSICHGELSNTLLTIHCPDRFERYINIAEEGYSRRWVECAYCGCATNIFDTFSIAQLADLESSYYLVDLKGKDLSERYAKLMNLPVGCSDNRQRVARILAQIDALQITQFSVADIGAGTGIFLSQLFAEAGDRIARAVAIEPDSYAAAHLSTLQQFDVIQDTFPLRQGLQHFDLVTLNKVLEHIADPLPFLSQIHSLLNQDTGVLYLEVPDVRTISLRPSNDNILGSLHRHLYSPLGLEIALRSCSYQPLQIERISEPSGKITIYAFALSTLPSSNPSP